MQVFERVSSEAQILYATHSLFLLNQNFPERHRLITRGPQGTAVDQKPYRSNWRLATDALGIYLTANIVFNSRVLLVEGDSDPMYLYELFRHFNKHGKLDADANTIGILSFSDAANLRFLLQLFKKDSDSSRLLVLFDGDSAGKNLSKVARSICEANSVQIEFLAENNSIEDYVISRELFIEAAKATIITATRIEDPQKRTALDTELQREWDGHVREQVKTTGKWFKDFCKTHAKTEVSKVALARSYVFSCREATNIETDVEQEAKALALCQKIVAVLNPPPLRGHFAVNVPNQ